MTIRDVSFTTRIRQELHFGKLATPTFSQSARGNRCVRSRRGKHSLRYHSHFRDPPHGSSAEVVEVLHHYGAAREESMIEANDSSQGRLRKTFMSDQGRRVCGPAAQDRQDSKRRLPLLLLRTKSSPSSSRAFHLRLSLFSNCLFREVLTFAL